MGTTVTALSPEYSNEEKRIKYTHASAVDRHEIIVSPENKVLVSQEAVEAAVEAVFKAEGRFSVDKKAATAFTALQKVYYDSDNEEITDIAEMEAGTPAADAGNTGDGTLGSVTLGSEAQAGTYKAICTSTGPGTAAAGTSAAAAHNTGDGTMTASPAAGANAKAGVYTAICIVEAANAGYFEVRDPDGIYIGVAEVAVEFSTGSHITFTIADGAADFVQGDIFTITVANADSGTFKVTDPNGLDLGDAVVSVAFTSNQINFTLTDGAADFAVDDFFTIAVTQTNYDAGYCYEDVAADPTDGKIHIYLKNNL